LYYAQLLQAFIYQCLSRDGSEEMKKIEGGAEITHNNYTQFRRFV